MARQRNGWTGGVPLRWRAACARFESRADEAQEAIRNCILKGDTSAFFKAVEIVHGKPRQAVEMNQALAGGLTFRWQDNLTARLAEGRRRVAATRSGPEDD